MSERSTLRSQRALREVQLLCTAFPELTLADVARAIEERGSGPAAHSDWESTVSPVLACARAFGYKENFDSPGDAARILNREFGLRLGLKSTWQTLSGVAALQLLIHGPVRANELLQRYRLTVPPFPKRKSPKRNPANPSNAASLVSGILRTEDL